MWFEARCGSVCLWSQHLAGGDRSPYGVQGRINSSRPYLYNSNRAKTNSMECVSLAENSGEWGVRKCIQEESGYNQANMSRDCGQAPNQDVTNAEPWGRRRSAHLSAVAAPRSPASAAISAREVYRRRRAPAVEPDPKTPWQALSCTSSRSWDAGGRAMWSGPKCGPYCRWLPCFLSRKRFFCHCPPGENMRGGRRK